MKEMIFTILTDIEKSLPYYLVGAGINYIQEPIIRKNGYPHYQWIQCIIGIGQLTIDDKKYTLEPGMGIFLYPYDKHEYYAMEGEWTVNWITFNGYGVESMIENIGINKSCVCYVSNTQLIISRITIAYNTSKSQSSLKGLECSEIVYGFLTDIKKYASSMKNSSIFNNHSKLELVVTFIEKNYNKTITLSQMSEIIDVTPEYICFLFKNIFNMRPFEYINKLRISKSKDLLINDKKLRIRDIGNMVGFDDPSYFVHIFKKIEGITPNAFRKSF